MMAYVTPANRRNGTIARFNFELYLMPKLDKTGNLTRITERANEVLSTKTYQYQVGLRVVAIDRRNAVHITGMIESADWNIGLIEYSIKTDDGKRYFVAENDIRQVLSLAVKPVQAITEVSSTQYIQTLDNVA